MIHCQKGSGLEPGKNLHSVQIFAWQYVVARESLNAVFLELVHQRATADAQFQGGMGAVTVMSG